MESKEEEKLREYPSRPQLSEDYETTNLKVPQTPEKDGPIPPDGFRLKGEIYDGFTPLEWRLLEYLWEAKKVGPNKRGTKVQKDASNTRTARHTSDPKGDLSWRVPRHQPSPTIPEDVTSSPPEQALRPVAEQVLVYALAAREVTPQFGHLLRCV